MSNNVHKNDSTVPIVIDGKDIGRIIFSPKDEAQYDIKFNFLRQQFAVQVYNLFAWRPTVLFVPESDDVEVTYHCAQGEKDPTIHLKKEHIKDGERRYAPLPIPNVCPPRKDTVFPIPLCKIEIPDQVIGAAELYARSKYNHKIELKKENVIELYMCNEKFQFLDLVRRFPKVMVPLQMMSIDFFASNTSLSDYQKNKNFFPKGHEPKDVGMEISMPNHMHLYISFYRDEQRAKALDRIMLTFMENKYAEDIMLLCHMEGVPSKSDPKMFDALRCGGCTLEQLRPKNLLSKDAFMPWDGSAAAFCLKTDRLEEDDRRLLIEKSKESMDRLFCVSKQLERQLQSMRTELVEKAEEFLDMLERARVEIPKLIYQSEDREILEHSKLMEWVTLPLEAHQEDVYMMFAYHMEVGHLLIRRSRIKRQNSNHEKIHLSMSYNCMFDIDLFWQNMEQYLPKNKRTGDRVRVFRATDNLNETPFWKEIQAQADANKYSIINSNKSFDGILTYANQQKLFADCKDLKSYIYHVAKSIDEGETIILALDRT